MQIKMNIGALSEVIKLQLCLPIQKEVKKILVKC